MKILVASAQNVLKVSNMALRFQPPTELIDTVKANAMRGGFGGGSGGSEPGSGGRRERLRVLCVIPSWRPKAVP